MEKQIEKYIKITTITLVAVMVLTAVFLPFITVRADDTDWDGNTPHDEAIARYNERINVLEGKGWFSKAAYALVCISTGAHPDWSVPKLVKNLGQIGKEGSVIDRGFINAAEIIYSAFQTTGIILVCLYFFLSLMDKVMQEQTSPEIILKKFLMLFVGIFFVLNGKTILIGIFDVSNVMISELETSLTIAGQTAGVANDVWEKMKDMSGLSLGIYSIGTMIEEVFPALVNGIYVIICYILGYGRALELCVRLMFAPIGIAPIVHDGMRSSGVRYIKKFASCALKSCVTLAIIFAAEFVIGSTASVDGVLARVIVPISAFAVLFKAGDFSNDIIGV